MSVELSELMIAVLKATAALLQFICFGFMVWTVFRNEDKIKKLSREVGALKMMVNKK